MEGMRDLEAVILGRVDNCDFQPVISMLSPLSLWERVRVREKIVIPAQSLPLAKAGAGIQRGCAGISARRTIHFGY